MTKSKKIENKPSINKPQQDISEELQEIEEDLISFNPEVFKGVPLKKKNGNSS